jgi:alpha-galactosidase
MKIKRRVQEWAFRTGLSVLACALFLLPCPAQQLSNGALSLSVDSRAGTYQISSPDGRKVLSARVGAEIDHRWVRSSEYTRCESVPSTFNDELGPGHQLSVTCSALAGRPDLIYILQVYDRNPYGTVQMKVHNGTGKVLNLEAIRSVEATAQPLIDLGGNTAADRILSDSFSEDRPDLKIFDLGQAPGGMHRAVGSQLIYNRESKQSLFLGALTSDRFLTVMHLQAEGSGAESRIASYTVDSTGTTEIQRDFDLKGASTENQVELSLPVAPGAELASERLLFEAGPDYHHQLLIYGEVIRRLHHARVARETPIGWWSWTAYYGAINQGETLANADWQAEHLASLGYKYFHIDEGYQYARGEYTTTNATQFPDGLRFAGHHITEKGLTLGIWTAPFEVTSRAWVYEHHKDWLVHNAQGEPIPLGNVWSQNTDTLYSLDTTHPGAQEYLRQTYKTLVREWGVRFIKLDFMDTTAIEGFRHRANTTALEAQRIGLQIIRDTVGDEVLLDKDGSPMLSPVGLVDAGRISVDTGHTFQRSRNAATGIAARFYMQGNFFLNDPDAFNLTDSYLVREREPQPPVSLAAAEASIALSAVSGGMYEIGDDMLVLGSEKDRLALVENLDLLNMAKIGRASTPVDLMTYSPVDGQPSIFFLAQSARQAILTVFNWTSSPASHSVKLADLGRPAEHTFSATDVLNHNESVAVVDGALVIENQPPQSVRVIKIIDTTVSKAAPTVTAQVPSEASSGETIRFSGHADPGGVPAVTYHWDFGDGTTTDSLETSHTYTRPGNFAVKLTVEGLDGLAAEQNFSIKVTGRLRVLPNLTNNRRFVEPTDR